MNMPPRITLRRVPKDALPFFVWTNVLPLAMAIQSAVLASTYSNNLTTTQHQITALCITGAITASGFLVNWTWRIAKTIRHSITGKQPKNHMNGIGREDLSRMLREAAEMIEKNNPDQTNHKEQDK